MPNSNKFIGPEQQFIIGLPRDSIQTGYISSDRIPQDPKLSNIDKDNSIPGITLEPDNGLYARADRPNVMTMVSILSRDNTRLFGAIENLFEPGDENGDNDDPNDDWEWTSDRMKINLEFPFYNDTGIMPVEFDMQNAGDICFVQATVLAPPEPGPGHYNLTQFVENPWDLWDGISVTSTVTLPEIHRPESPQHIPLYGHWWASHGQRKMTAILSIETNGEVSLHNTAIEGNTNDTTITSNSEFADGSFDPPLRNPAGIATHTKIWRLAEDE